MSNNAVVQVRLDRGYYLVKPEILEFTSLLLEEVREKYGPVDLDRRTANELRKCYPELGSGGNALACVLHCLRK